MPHLKTVFAALFATIAVAAPARAQCGNCAVSTVSGITYTCGSLTGGCGAPDDSDCDSNDRTPTETLDCKITYWNKRLDEAKKRDDQAQKDIAHAQERVQAFSDAKRGK